MRPTITTVVSGLSYPESPRWHQDRLWFSDMYAREVMSAHEDGTDLRMEARVPQCPSGLGWLTDGRLLVVSMCDCRLLRREHNGALVTHADLTNAVDGDLNDMVVDSDGRAFVGSFGFNLRAGEAINPAGLIRVDPDGAVASVADDLWFPNGSVITPDGVLIVNETFGNRITAFDIADDGELGRRREWARFGDLPATTDRLERLNQLAIAPDGCAIDAEHALWVADALGGRVLRVDHTGAIVDEIVFETGAFACVLGGSDARTLFVCISSTHDEQSCLRARQAAVVAVRVTVPAMTCA